MSAKAKFTHGGPRTPSPGKRLGRPPQDETAVRVLISMTPEQRDTLQAKAAEANLTVSEFVRRKCGL